MELAWGKECGGNFSRTSGEVKIGDNVVAMLRTWTGSCKRQDGGETIDQTSNITILHYYIITKCLFLTIVYNYIFLNKYIIVIIN